MKRLTKRLSDGSATYYLYGLGAFDPIEALSECETRLAAYEDTGLEPEEVTTIKHAFMGREISKITEFDGIPIRRLQELAQADKDGQLLICSPTAKDGDPKPPCFYNDNGGDWCLGLAHADMDEPIEQCKLCLYCESGYRFE